MDENGLGSCQMVGIAMNGTETSDCTNTVFGN